jgi:hypothetical protein
VLGVDEDDDEDDDGVDEVVAAGFDDGGRFRDVSAMMKYQLLRIRHKWVNPPK